MGLQMAERKAVTKEKATMLDELCALTGWSRGHARQVLSGARTHASQRRPLARGSSYAQIVPVLTKVWATYGGPAPSRLAPFMAEGVAAMERFGELELTAGERPKLLAVSAASIDRLLAPERCRLQVKGRSGTKPGSLLRDQVPIRTFAEWDEKAPMATSVGQRKRHPLESRGTPDKRVRSRWSARPHSQPVRNHQMRSRRLNFEPEPRHRECPLQRRRRAMRR